MTVLMMRTVAVRVWLGELLLNLRGCRLPPAACRLLLADWRPDLGNGTMHVGTWRLELGTEGQKLEC